MGEKQDFIDRGFKTRGSYGYLEEHVREIRSFSGTACIRSYWYKTCRLSAAGNKGEQKH